MTTKMNHSSSNRNWVKAPWCLYLPRKTKADKRYSINLNHYRNAHHTENHKAKQIYKEAMKDQIALLGSYKKIKVSYYLYPPTNAALDIGNVRSIHEKYFLDALVELGHLEDDNHKFQPVEETYYVRKDNKDPCVFIVITEVSDSSINIDPKGQLDEIAK